MMLNNPMLNDESKSMTAGSNMTMPKNTLPNEQAGFAVEGFVKIFDPKTQEIFVETRA
jgi:hypothetical protein